MEGRNTLASISRKQTAFYHDFASTVVGFRPDDLYHQTIVSTVSSLKFINEYYEKSFSRLICIAPGNFVAPITSMLKAHTKFNYVVGEVYGRLSAIFEFRWKMLSSLPDLRGDSLKECVSTLVKDFETLPDIEVACDNYVKAIDELSDQMGKAAGTDNYEKSRVKMEEAIKELDRSRDEYMKQKRELSLVEDSIKAMQQQGNDLAKYKSLLEERRRVLRSEQEDIQKKMDEAKMGVPSGALGKVSQIVGKFLLGSDYDPDEKRVEQLKNYEKRLSRDIEDLSSKIDGISLNTGSDVYKNLLSDKAALDISLPDAKDRYESHKSVHKSALDEHIRLKLVTIGMDEESRDLMCEILEGLSIAIGHVANGLGGIKGSVTQVKKAVMSSGQTGVSALILSDFAGSMIKGTCIDFVMKMQNASIMEGEMVQASRKSATKAIAGRNRDLDFQVPPDRKEEVVMNAKVVSGQEKQEFVMENADLGL